MKLTLPENAFCDAERNIKNNHERKMNEQNIPPLYFVLKFYIKIARNVRVDENLDPESP